MENNGNINIDLIKEKRCKAHKDRLASLRQSTLDRVEIKNRSLAKMIKKGTLRGEHHV